MLAAGFEPGSRSAIAVSGGGDSVALMRLFTAWAQEAETALPFVLTVDHGLRKDSRADAERVAAWAEELGLSAIVLTSGTSAPKANVEDWARGLRYRLMGTWCREHGIGALFVAHTLDDQAETFLLRLGRGSGVDGLSGMSPYGHFPLPDFADLALHRPLLGFTRAELRAELARRGIPWLEDPMNADVRFARTRVRTLLAHMEEAGIAKARVAQAAAHLARARHALEAETERFLAAHAHFASEGFALLDGAGLRAAECETALRVLAAVLMRVSGAAYRPRFERLERLLAAIRGSRFAGRTLLGCRIGYAPRLRQQFGPATLMIAREPPRKRGSGEESASEMA